MTLFVDLTKTLDWQVSACNILKLLGPVNDFETFCEYIIIHNKKGMNSTRTQSSPLGNFRSDLFTCFGGNSQFFSWLYAIFSLPMLKTFNMN